MAHLELHNLGRWVWPWQLMGNDLWSVPITSILFTNCWQAQPLTVKWVGMISVTLCHSSCKSSSQQGKPRSWNGRGRSRQVQPWLEVPLIGGQKSKIKTATLIEPAVNVGISRARELYHRIWRQHQEKSKGWSVRENWFQIPALPLNKWPWASYLISLSHHLPIHKIKIIKSTSQGRV